MFCREQLTQLRQRMKDFNKRGVPLAAVSPAGGKPTGAVCGMLNLGYPCYGDPTGEAYEAFGIKQGTFGNLYNWHTLSKGFLAFLRGFRQGRAVGDNRRLPAAFIIDREGTIRWTWRGKDAADNASAGDLLSALDKLNLSS